MSQDPSYYFAGYIGVASAIGFSAIGATYATAKSGSGLYALAVEKPQMMFKSFIPIVMGGVLAIYGLIMAIIIFQKIPAQDYSDSDAYAHLAAGLITGLTCLGSGIAIGSIGNNGARAVIKQQNMFVTMVLILIFAEAIGLYGLILSLILVGGDN